MRKRSFGKKLLSFILSLCLLMGGLSLQPVELHADGETQTGKVIYVNSASDSAKDDLDDTTWGYSADKPMETLKGAYGKVPVDNVKSTIVVMSELVLAPSEAPYLYNNTTKSYDANPKFVEGTLDLDYFVYASNSDHYLFPDHVGEVVITAMDVDGTVYNDGALNFNGETFRLSGNTTIENIKIAKNADYLYACFNDLTLGNGIEKGSGVTYYPATNILMGIDNQIRDKDGNISSADVRDVCLTINSGSISKVYGGCRSNNPSAMANCDVNIIVNGGTVTTLYGTDWGNPKLRYENTAHYYHDDINITVNAGTVTNLYATHACSEVLGDARITIGEKAMVTHVEGKPLASTYEPYGPAVVYGKTILEFSGFDSEQALPTTIVADFDCLSLKNSQITIGDENAWWSSITSLEMVDDSTLTFTKVPTVPSTTTTINVTASKAGEEWNMNTPLIIAPAGTGNIFTLTAPISRTFAYSAGESQDTWTLAKQTVLPFGVATGETGTTMDIDLKLPDGTSFTKLDADATTYQTFLAKLNDLNAAGSGTEVPVVDTVDIKGEIAIYVDPEDGDDTNKGTLDMPIKTIQKALEYVASLQSGEEPYAGIVVYLMGGTYNVTETITISDAHSGKNQIPVIISAYNDEEVVITGGTQIAGNQFKPVSEISTAAYNKLAAGIRDEVVAVNLTDLRISTANAAITKNGQNYRVFVDGEELSLSRYPNVTNLALNGKVLHFGEITQSGSSCGAKGTNANDPDIRFEMTDLRPTLWENTGNIWLTGSLYEEWASTTLRVKEINATTGVIRTDGGSGWGAKTDPSNTYYYFNVLEELDVPGEFYLDTEAGILYLYPISDMSKATITYSAMQENLVNLNQTTNLVLNGLTLECGGYGIYMQDCKETLVQNCTMRNLMYGARIHGEQSGIIYSEIHQIGIDSVILGENVYPDYDFTPEENFLQNCYIYDTGITALGRGYVYVLGTGNVVSHNLFQGMAGCAIYLRYHQECIIEYNEIVGAPTLENDGGAIYAPWEPRNLGTHVRYNYIHDIGVNSDSWNPNGIYFDEGLRENYAYGNIMSNVPSGFLTNSGSENVIIHNIVANGREKTNTSLRGSNNFDKYTIEDRIARSPYFRTVYENYTKLSEAEKTVLKERYPLYVKLFETIEDANATGAAGLFTSQGNYVHENLIYNHGTIDFTDKNDVADNTITTSNPFANVEEHDFTLKDDSLINLADKLPGMDRIGIITDTDHSKESISAFNMYAPSDGNQKVDPFKVLLKWSNAAGADDYVVKISKSEDMSESLTFSTLNKYYYFEHDEFFAYDTTYYWTVTANTTAESRIADSVVPNNGEPYSFKTMTREDYLAANPLDTTELEEVITEAETLLAQVSDENDGGLYENGTRAALQEQITAAKAVMSDLESQDQVSVNLAKTALAEQIRITKVRRLIQYVTFEDLDVNDWSNVTDAKALVLSVVDDELQVVRAEDAADGTGQAMYVPGVGPRDILCFQYKIDNKANWHGFVLAQVNPDAYAINRNTENYFICINPTQIELQKRQQGLDNSGIQIIKEIDDTIFDGGEYYDIEIGAINYADGSVGFHFKINDTLIFDPEVVRDTSEDVVIPGYNAAIVGNPILNTPTFGVLANRVNGTEYLKLASTADYTALETELAEKASLTGTDYTTESWNAYQALADEAEALDTELLKAEQAVIDELTAELKAAREALVAASNSTPTPTPTATPTATPSATPTAEPTATPTAAPSVTPEIIAEGTDTSYTKGSNAEVSVHCTGDFKKLTGVKMDAQEVDSANYTVKEGSTIVTFKTAYLETLSVGEHIVTLLYDDGSSVNSKLTILAATTGGEMDGTQEEDTSGEDNTEEEDDAAESVAVTETSGSSTGDGSHLILWIVLMAAAAILCGLFSLKVRKSKE